MKITAKNKKIRNQNNKTHKETNKQKSRFSEKINKTD